MSNVDSSRGGGTGVTPAMLEALANRTAARIDPKSVDPELSERAKRLANSWLMPLEPSDVAKKASAELVKRAQACTSGSADLYAEPIVVPGRMNVDLGRLLVQHPEASVGLDDFRRKLEEALEGFEVSGIGAVKAGGWLASWYQLTLNLSPARPGKTDSFQDE